MTTDEPVELRNVRVVSPLEAARRSARADLAWQAAHAQLVAPDRPGEGAYAAHTRRADAVRRMFDVEVRYQLAAGVPLGV